MILLRLILAVVVLCLIFHKHPDHESRIFELETEVYQLQKQLGTLK